MPDAYLQGQTEFRAGIDQLRLLDSGKASLSSWKGRVDRVLLSVGSSMLVNVYQRRGLDGDGVRLAAFANFS